MSFFPKVNPSQVVSLHISHICARSDPPVYDCTIKLNDGRERCGGLNGKNIHLLVRELAISIIKRECSQEAFREYSVTDRTWTYRPAINELRPYTQEELEAQFGEYTPEYLNIFPSRSFTKAEQVLTHFFMENTPGT